MGLILLNLSLKWPVVVITFVLTFSIIYAANYWRQQHLVVEPLREQLLALEAVEDVNMENGRSNEISVSLGHVSQFAEVYREIQSVLKTRNEDLDRLTIVDRRNPYLNSLYSRIEFALMEGERQGNYTEMSKEINLLLEEEAELNSYSLRVDQQAIYLQLDAGDYYLYEVIPIKKATFATDKANSRI